MYIYSVHVDTDSCSNYCLERSQDTELILSCLVNYPLKHPLYYDAQ